MFHLNISHTYIDITENPRYVTQNNCELIKGTHPILALYPAQVLMTAFVVEEDPSDMMNGWGNPLETQTHNINPPLSCAS